MAWWWSAAPRTVAAPFPVCTKTSTASTVTTVDPRPTDPVASDVDPDVQPRRQDLGKSNGIPETAKSVDDGKAVPYVDEAVPEMSKPIPGDDVQLASCLDQAIPEPAESTVDHVQLAPTLGKEASLEENKASPVVKHERLLKGKAIDDFPPPPEADKQPYVFVAGTGPVRHTTPFSFTPTPSAALTLPGATAVFGLSSTPQFALPSSANVPSSAQPEFPSSANVPSSSGPAFPSSSNAPPSAPTAVFGLSSNTQAPTQSTALTAPSLAAVPSSAPTAVFGLASVPRALSPTDSTSSRSSSVSSAPFTPAPTQSTALTTPSPTFVPPPAPQFQPIQTHLVPPPAPLFPLTQTYIVPRTSTHCPTCGHRNNLPTVRPRPDSINVGRPYRICSNRSCGSWNGWADARGLVPGQYCNCANPAELRLTLMNDRDWMGRRQAFYDCQIKACGAWQNCLDAQGNPRLFTDAEVRSMIAAGRI
ncbi:hypothetical protein BDW02DRAFT_274262 [Decorospora gaudefroyi]|uniref:GRF-like zinc ribbon domain-containing protein n=1 Tax=Decorospora gaudefroyi TaxID=184978 RepID=A0A6A5KYX5_9PLEO|nr:hypothetical protein BDW02DRAFT_274262 [Decorospora gaudefroyi]